MKKEKYLVIKFNGENDECLRLFDNIDEAVAMAKSIARTNKMSPSQTYHCNMILQYCKWDGSRLIGGVCIIKIFENEEENERKNKPDMPDRICKACHGTGYIKSHSDAPDRSCPHCGYTMPEDGEDD